MLCVSSRPSRFFTVNCRQSIFLLTLRPSDLQSLLESVSNQFHFKLPIRTFYSNHVKPAIVFFLHICQIQFSASLNMLYFSWGYSIHGRFRAPFCYGLYFNEREHVLLFRNKVDLTEPAAEVLFKYLKTQALQVL